MAHILKVVKGTFFGTEYWSGKMKIAAVDRIRPPNDPFWDDIFDRVEGAQRELNKRRVLDFMVPYLLNGAHPFDRRRRLEGRPRFQIQGAQSR
jgi:DNA sulfur modification protein DndB